MIRLSLIIPAAGSGVRLGMKTPKPFIELGGRTILQHTIDKFIDIPELGQLLIVASAQNIDRVKSLVSDHDRSDVDISVVEGGDERQDSIGNALKFVDKRCDLVAIHDAVRPFIEKNVVEECISKAMKYGAAIPGIPVKDTVKVLNDEQLVESTPDRSSLWQIQTPQIFKRQILFDAYDHAKNAGFTGTDDSSLVENLGIKVHVVKSSYENFKITYPIDLKLAELKVGG
jgi:2-C-methyl-D-erythritol 4-phosphate cytidylyltransferase